VNSQSDLDPRRARELVGDVQRLGLESAAAVVERFTAMVERASQTWRPEGPSPPAEDGRGTFVRLLGDAARLAEAYLTFLDGMAAFVAASAGWAGGASGEGVERVVFPAAVPGSSVAARLWIHNTTGDPADVELQATALTATMGGTIAPEAVTFGAGSAWQVAAGEGLEVTLRLKIPEGCRPGTYNGLVVASGLPGESIALRIQVLDGGSSG
jgi:hypothetical protein